MEEKVLKVGLMGLGTVGTGVYKVIENQKEEFPHKIGSRLEIKKILVREDAIPDAKSRYSFPSVSYKYTPFPWSNTTAERL